MLNGLLAETPRTMLQHPWCGQSTAGRRLALAAETAQRIHSGHALSHVLKRSQRPGVRHAHSADQALGCGELGLVDLTAVFSCQRCRKHSGKKHFRRKHDSIKQGQPTPLVEGARSY